MKTEQVILVDEQDNEMGYMEKMEAHTKAVLHRAFSIFIFNNKGEMLLQQRALQKYHSAGLWTNACCSHPRPGETLLDAAKRRLVEEMGIDVSLEKLFDFVYKAELENGLTEYEYDHVLLGNYDGPVVFNTEEVQDVCYKAMRDIRESLAANPAIYTSWFQLAFPRIDEWWKKQYENRLV
ncbi:MAG TPA: isopentenyl-diphosphate Delta-isomerase [Chitinophagaceae bacterium]|nr:isopentenyl-diphosphate Delta-isomerase [Chitinophagaceae bacterium]